MDRLPAAAQWLDRLTFALLVVVAVAIGLTPKALALAIPVVVVWIAKLAAGGGPPARSALVAPMLALLIAAACASYFAYDPVASWARARTFAALLLAMIVGNTATSYARIRTVACAVLASAIVAAGCAAWQRAFGIGLSFSEPPAWMAQAGLSSADILTRVDTKRVHTPPQWVNAVASLDQRAKVRLDFLRQPDDHPITVTVSAGQMVAAGLNRLDAVKTAHPARAIGFYNHYLPFSYLLTMVALLAWGMALRSTRNDRWLFLGVFGVLSACLAVTVTRSAMAFLIFAALVVVWRVAGWKLRAATVAFATLVLLLGSLWLRHERGVGWISIADAGTQYRLAIWRDGLHLVRQHPIVGVGFDNVFRHPEHWSIDAFRRFPLVAHFHSNVVEYAVDGGLLTLAAWLWLLVAYGFMLVRTVRGAEHDPPLHGISLGIFGGFVAFLGISLVQYIGADPAIMTLFWLLMGLAIAIDQLGRNRGAQPPADFA